MLTPEQRLAALEELFGTGIRPDDELEALKVLLATLVPEVFGPNPTHQIVPLGPDPLPAA